ncbi:uncharacterized protein SPAPADRAFT_49942 [Spathaspora passalidarum NRRL Y-27907]|uniref:Uncharacterized protein n=1 Tax=Spathaspora passalidarum (strain NRRL Y-27907 / 11-Y1) TaxID=619300 RepID=G3AKX3_SPAPN|nr:uncharacterized protein SPAPADRAFT_49942 [Spathaspora passalidarum NRRL Y-27907]EGW33016.1 hypothetical protein SPAPADRAFT_49942 [Spathaspora passalidarum NRRL Y-27907]
MFTRSSRNIVRRIASRRFQHTATAAESAAKESPFTNKYNFDLNPPRVHEYWNYRNATVLLAFIPLFLVVAELGKTAGNGLRGLSSFIEFAESEKSPMKEQTYGKSQKSIYHKDE